MARPRKTSAEPAKEMTLQEYPRHERENAYKVHGAALRELGRRYGLAMSSMERMTDDKLRQQISLAQNNDMQRVLA